MTVDEMIVELQAASADGFGETPVVTPDSGYMFATTVEPYWTEDNESKYTATLKPRCIRMVASVDEVYI